jgi:predicted membrane GTPase involved in stress response
MAWESISAIATLLLTIGALVAFYIRQASMTGAIQSDLAAQERRMNELAILQKDQGIALVAHTAAIATHEGSFKVIDTKLDYISKAVDRVCREAEA